MPWWLDPGGQDWTDEELSTRRAIAVFAMIVFIPVFTIEIWLLNGLGVDRNLGALIDLASCGFFAFWAARQICQWCWPEMVRKADENAARRLAPRQSDC